MKVLDASIILLAVINLNVQRSLAVLGRGIGRIARNKEMGDKDDHVRFRMMVKEDEHPRDRIIVAKHDDSISGISNAANKRQSSKPREEFSQSTSNMAAIRHLYIDVASKSIFATNSGSRTLQQDACDSDLSTMSTCVNSNDGCDTDCITQALEEIFYSQSGDMQCSYFSSEFCPRVSTCGCETCKDEITGYLSCIASCTIQCSSEYTPYPDTDKSASSTTEDDYCPDEYEAARDCTASMDACAACMDYAYNSMFGPDNTTSCSSFVNGICPAITTNCDCGDCRQAIQDVRSTFAGGHNFSLQIFDIFCVFVCIFFKKIAHCILFFIICRVSNSITGTFYERSKTIVSGIVNEQMLLIYFFVHSSAV
jgi:hypothetical protein